MSKNGGMEGGERKRDCYFLILATGPQEYYLGLFGRSMVNEKKGKGKKRTSVRTFI